MRLLLHNVFSYEYIIRMSINYTPKDALVILVSRAGSQYELGNALGVSQATVSRWILDAHQIPAEHAIPAEVLYGVSRHDLRPDIYPREEGDAPQPARFHGVDRQAHRAAA